MEIHRLSDLILSVSVEENDSYSKLNVSPSNIKLVIGSTCYSIQVSEFFVLPLV